MLNIHILTIFPQMFEQPFSVGLFQKAIERGVLSIDVRNIRNYTHDKHHTTDDYPYGGGAGMVMKPEPIFEAVETLKAELEEQGVKDIPVILMSPQGRIFTQEVALELSQQAHLIFICGEYEGVDERVVQHLVTDEISIGDYVLTGGEFAAMVVTNAVARLVPGFLGSAESLVAESHTAGLLEYPQYTRPPEFRGWTVPDVLLSGNHAQIADWRKEQSLLRTAERRPDLIGKIKLSADDKKLIKAHRSTVSTGVEGNE
ncbi:MAG TPA: tRNA (guanosine(37)-N1)-methyltransferase TrmD [Dehalococcoidales bacterium]|nr:tRNA (guanosine(37)-N1)-methyltransferase TrmD [Dehalococcoidales bacterium]